MNDSSTGAERILKIVPPRTPRQVYEFGPFRLNTVEKQLFRNEQTVPLTPKTLELLVLLVENHGHLVEKETVMSSLWPDTFVEESNLTQHVSRLRKALSEGATEVEWIETVPRRGYRFIAPLKNGDTTPPIVTTQRRFVRSLLTMSAAAVAIAFLVMNTASDSKAVSLPAQEAYLKGRHFWNRRTDADFKKAIEYFRTAVELEPRYAAAWVGLADAYNFTGQAPRAQVAARRALELDGNLAGVHATLGNISTFHDFDFPTGAAHFHRAIALKPDYAAAHQWLAFNLAAQGRMSEALVAIERARDIEPVSPIINTDVATLLYYARRYDDAIAAARHALELDPAFDQAHVIAGMACLATGKLDEAEASFDRAGSEHGRLGALQVAARRGRHEEARRSYEELEHSRSVRPYVLAHAAVTIGESDRALTLIEQALAERDGQLTMIGVDPIVDPLRSDTRFQRVRAAMKLR